MTDLGRAAPRPHGRPRHRGDRLGGQDLDQGGAAPRPHAVGERAPPRPPPTTTSWGVPLTLARMPKATRFAIAEIGMNHPGEITPLTAMVRPHIAIVTATSAPVHLEFFPSVEAIADAKAEIFSGLEPGGVAIINRDSPHYERLDAAARQSPAGHGLDLRRAREGRRQTAPRFHAGADPLAHHGDGSPAREISGSVSAPPAATSRRTRSPFCWPTHALGADLDAAATALAFFQAQQGRGQRSVVETDDGPFTLIDESYNANPGLDARRRWRSAGRWSRRRAACRVAVLGDMLELGSRSPRAARRSRRGYRRQSLRSRLRRRSDDALARRHARGPDPGRVAGTRLRSFKGPSSRPCAPGTSSSSRARTAAAWRRSSPRSRRAARHPTPPTTRFSLPRSHKDQASCSPGSRT